MRQKWRLLGWFMMKGLRQLLMDRCIVYCSCIVNYSRIVNPAVTARSGTTDARCWLRRSTSPSSRTFCTSSTNRARSWWRNWRNLLTNPNQSTSSKWSRIVSWTSSAVRSHRFGKKIRIRNTYFPIGRQGDTSKILFNIVEAPLKKLLIFDVCVVWWCSDGPINSQEYKRFETYAVTMKMSMTEYHHWITGQAYHLF